jgi:DNA polymerase-1
MKKRIPKKYILLDCNYLCHRAKHTTGELSYKGNVTGTIYGFLESLIGFQDLFNSCDFVFCWDSRTSKRKEIYSEYKANRQRKEYTKEDMEFDKAFRKQMSKLRTTYLPMIGFKNIFIQKGYESDDIIASICNNNEKRKNNNEIVIVSSDSDLFQCVSYCTSLYNPQTNKMLTLQNFKRQYGINPVRWGLVKSLAGCVTDNVKGIKGVGEKTAVKYLLNKLKKDSKAYKSISSPEGIKIFNRNKELVILPFKNTNTFRLRKDNLSEIGWKKVTDMLGMKSIRNKMPFRYRKRKTE